MTPMSPFTPVNPEKPRSHSQPWEEGKPGPQVTLRLLVPPKFHPQTP